MEQFLRLPAVIARVGLGKTSLYQLIGEGRFPKPIPISDHAVAWLASEIDGWMADRVRESRAEKSRATA